MEPGVEPSWRGVVVLGSHRSGTSAVTGVIDALGLPASRPEDRYEARRWNARGNFEARSITEFDEELLRRLGGAWWAPPLPPTGWAEGDELEDLRVNAAFIFAAAHPAGRWVWKDPRACVLMPFWDIVLGEDIPRIVVLRHPLECARSLADRSQMPEDLALAMTERNLRTALRDSAGRTVWITTYDELLSDLETWCLRAAEFVKTGGESLADPLPVDKAREFLDASLRHHEEAPGTARALPPGLARIWSWAASRVGVHPALSIKGLPDEGPGTGQMLASAFRTFVPPKESGATAPSRRARQPRPAGRAKGRSKLVVDPRSFLFVTIDSCRYDTFADLRPRNLMQIGPLHLAKAPGTFTYASHAAMFVGFTPGDFEVEEPFVNPANGRIFRMGGGRLADKRLPWVDLTGRNIVDGLRALGYRTVGSGAVGWFNPATPTAQVLIADFEDFLYVGDFPSVHRQVEFVTRHLLEVQGHQPVFAFLNIGETHAPYYFDGAPWPREGSRVPRIHHDAAEHRRRQTACLEFLDGELGPLLDAFKDANTLVCGDHGDAWGEDGFWGHGLHHQKVIDVPLLMRLQHPPAPD